MSEPSPAVIEAVEWAMCRLVHGEDWTVPAALPDSIEPRHRVAACYSCQRNAAEVARAAEAAALLAAADDYFNMSSDTKARPHARSWLRARANKLTDTDRERVQG